MTSIRDKRIQLIGHPSEKAIERQIPFEDIERIIYTGFRIEDVVGKYPNTYLAIGRVKDSHVTVVYTEWEEDIVVVTVRPSKRYEINLYKRHKRISQSRETNR